MGTAKVGYAMRVADAGRYNREEALVICADAMLSRRGHPPSRRCRYGLADVEAMFDSYRKYFPGHDPEQAG